MNDKSKVRKIRHSPVADPVKVKAAREAVKRVKAKNDRFKELEEIHDHLLCPGDLPGYTWEYIRMLEAKIRDMERTWEPPVPYVVANERKK
jgi:hypothetical protein